ncbi:MAG TPA: hypothetical protein VJ302_06890 [Blastocatellia bacterium]|nr:hypothetical protein [Blastocatellia bacterium]
MNENREAKRKIQIRLAEIEAEAEMLRSQLSTFNAIIGQTELALRRVLFPQEGLLEEQAPPPSRYAPPTSQMPVSLPTTRRPADLSSSPMSAPLSASEAEIEAEVAKIQQSENSSNIRFNDFRIPQAATIVLREANGPLHVTEIYRRLAEGGFEFRGQHQLITLAVSLSRSKRFRKVAPGTFELHPDHRAGQVA